MSIILFLIFNKEAVLKIIGFGIRSSNIGVIDGIKRKSFKSAKAASPFVL
jgi:hypothetical protein